MKESSTNKRFFLSSSLFRSSLLLGIRAFFFWILFVSGFCYCFGACANPSDGVHHLAPTSLWQRDWWTQSECRGRGLLGGIWVTPLVTGGELVERSTSNHWVAWFLDKSIVKGCLPWFLAVSGLFWSFFRPTGILGWQRVDLQWRRRLVLFNDISITYKNKNK